jgi:peptide/nickel transport system permease protein
MIGYLLRRLSVSILVLVLVSIGSFLLLTLAPGSPYPWGDLNPQISEEVKENYRRKFHLDEPVPTQYWLMITDLVRGRLVSSADDRPVLAKIGERLPATLVLNGVAILIIYAFAIPLGIFSARYAGRWPDQIASVGVFLCIALPSFWVAYLVILGLVKYFAMPVTGVSTMGAVFGSPMREWLDHAWHVLLPATILALAGIATQSRFLRASLRESLGEDYIRTARAKGLRTGPLLYKHALRNSLRPILTGFGLLLPVLLGGSVIIESIFAYPGIGRLSYEAVLGRDYPTLMALNFAAAALVLLGNLVADLLYATVDPRVKLE